jgi:hypothetical protein
MKIIQDLWGKDYIKLVIHNPKIAVLYAVTLRSMGEIC